MVKKVTDTSYPRDVPSALGKHDVSRRAAQGRDSARAGQALFGGVLHAEPINPREGMVANADGTNWTPGSNGQGPYFFDGSDWRKLALLSTSGVVEGNIEETQINDGAILARLAANETVTGTWLFDNDTNGEYSITIRNEDLGTGAYARLLVEAAGAGDTSVIAHGSGRTVSRWGVTLGDW